MSLDVFSGSEKKKKKKKICWPKHQSNATDTKLTEYLKYC